LLAVLWPPDLLPVPPPQPVSASAAAAAPATSALVLRAIESSPLFAAVSRFRHEFAPYRRITQWCRPF
jgi:hypothetical protein